MINNINENGFNDFLEMQLPIFDDILAKEQTPLSIRPIHAAIRFVEHCIVEIKDDNKENYLEKEWFRIIYQLINNWYIERYANAINSTNDHSAIGIVLIHNTPFQLKIPLFVNQEKKGEDCRWICMPISILNNENVINWIQNKPNMDKIEGDELILLTKTISNIAESIRSIHINLKCNYQTSETINLAASIPVHLDKAALDILSLESNRISNSYWETHLALEKSLKLVILQNGLKNKKTHNLKELCEIANSIEGKNIDPDNISLFLSDKESIQQRYWGKVFTIKEAITNYYNAAKVVSTITRQLKRPFDLKNIRLLIKQPNWGKSKT